MFHRQVTFVFAVVVAFTASIDRAFADKSLEGIACSSIYLNYLVRLGANRTGNPPEGEIFYNEVTVNQSADGTFFAVCGFNAGYFGL